MKKVKRRGTKDGLYALLVGPTDTAGNGAVATAFARTSVGDGCSEAQEEVYRAAICVPRCAELSLTHLRREP